jgi:hypothetical protein
MSQLCLNYELIDIVNVCFKKGVNKRLTLGPNTEAIARLKHRQQMSMRSKKLLNLQVAAY